MVVFATGVHDGLAGHAVLFPASPVSAAALATLTATFDTKLAAANQDSVAQTAEKNTARDAVINALRQIAAYVEGVAQGNADTIRAAEFEVTLRTHFPQTPLDKPDIQAAVNVMTTKIQLRVKAVRNAQSYEVQMRTVGGAWQGAGTYPQARNILLEGLTPGTVYEFRVRAIGGSLGYSDWSDTTHMCT